MIVICTHHKTGTVWMQRTFSGIADALNQRMCNLGRESIHDADIYFLPNPPIPRELSECSYRGLHLIRDPRDVILSGMHYHLRAPERWLHVPEAEYGGLSYQEKLNSLDGDGRLYLEMERLGAWTIRAMVEWNYDDGRFFEARYEDLIDGGGYALFEEILSFLGIVGSDAERSLEVFRVNNLRTYNFSQPDDTHVRSGLPRQWQVEFRRRHGLRFIETCGDCLIRLGYEKDDSWVYGLPE